MFLQYKFILFILLMFVSCHSSYGKVNLNQVFKYFYQIYHPKSHPTSNYFRTIEPKYGNFEPSLAHLISYNDDEQSYNIRSDFAPMEAPSPPPKVVSVDDFQAKGNGKTDDTEAFKEAWNEACSTKNSVLLVPKNKNYILKPVTFSGPCKSSLTMNIYGTIIASGNTSEYERDRRHWIMFENVQNFNVQGDGVIDGNGEIWWINSCKINKTLPCKRAPTAVTFFNCTDLRVENLMIKNAQQMHLSLQRCVDVRAVDLMILAPGHSPNTDGIHVTNSQNIRISRCTIKTGDDCISIVSGSKNVVATDIICGPGHGISIGSLGAGNSEDYVSDVFVNRAKLSGTTNGVRIKTYQGGSGYAKNIIFKNIEMQNVSNPIIINQHYCDQKEPCKEQELAVQVRNVMYQNIKGTTNSETAIKLNCSNSYPCQGIVLQDVNFEGQRGEKAESTCQNVHLVNIGNVAPKCS